MKKKFSVLFFVVALAVSLGLVSETPALASPGLVGLWHFDEGIGSTAGDSSGYGNDGILSGGKFGNALSFDGTNNYVEVLDADSLDLTSDFTIEAWIKPTAINRFQGILQKGSFASTFGKYEVHLTNNAADEELVPVGDVSVQSAWL